MQKIQIRLYTNHNMSKLIGFLYRNVLKNILFLRDAEHMHSAFGKVGYILGKYKITRYITHKLFYYEHPYLAQKVLDIKFDNPIGIAWGFDKDILLPNIAGDIGFGWEEVWSITYGAYKWNPGKRLIRLKSSKWILVNYGLKNKWISYAKDRLQSINPKIPILVSIAKTNCTKTTDTENGIQDYLSSVQKLKNLDSVSGFVLNIWCPNSFGGEDFATPAHLEQLLKNIIKLNISKPILVKLPIDKSWEDLSKLIKICIKYNISWVIISNLIKNREHIKEKEIIHDLPWGISGIPTRERSDYLIWETYKSFGDKIKIIWVGGIFSAQDAYNKIRQWASLVQLITGMIYQWPQLIGDINKWLVDLMEKDGYNHISQAIWANHTRSSQ